MQETRSSGFISLRCISSLTMRSVASRISSASLCSTVMAPRRAKRRMAADSSSRGFEDGFDAVRVVPHLGAREPDRSPAGDEVVLVADAVVGLLGGGAVVAEAVGFDDEVQLGPEEVDAVLAEAALRLWRWEAGSFDEAQELAFEGAVG